MKRVPGAAFPGEEGSHCIFPRGCSKKMKALPGAVGFRGQDFYKVKILKNVGNQVSHTVKILTWSLRFFGRSIPGDFLFSLRFLVKIFGQDFRSRVSIKIFGQVFGHDFRSRFSVQFFDHRPF